MSKIKKTDAVSIEVFEKDEQFWTTSLDVAEKFGKQHKNVLRDIENLECSDNFKRLNFEPLSQTVRGGTQKYYIISCRGFQRLGMSFTGPKAAEWKEKYIDVFEEMKDKFIKDARQANRQNEKRVTLEWKQLREDGKLDRRAGTDADKRFVDYTVSRGSSLPPARWFNLLTEAKYDAIIIPDGHMEIRRRMKESGKKNGVDTFTSEELKKNTMMDLITGRIMDEVLIDGEDHHKIYKKITGNFKQYGNMFNVIFLPSPIKTLTLAR